VLTCGVVWCGVCAVDYIYTTGDLLSREAFVDDKIRLTPWREPFTHWLPLYLSADHFKRALPFIQKTCVQLSPGYGPRFHPEMALDVLCKLMNTLTVLLSDKGLHASQKACEAFAAVHRLLIGR
jgi:hypothetical protein